MALSLSIAALLVAFVGVSANQLVTFFPRLGLGLLHRVGSVQAAVGAVSLTLATLSVWLDPHSRAVLWVAIAAVVLVALSPWLLNPRVAVVPLTDPPRRSAADAALADETPVLALALGEAACAWPLPLLVPHHLIHDTVGAQRVLATWCAACRSGVVYAPDVAGRVLTFEVAGVYRGNLVLRDRQTRTLWQQATGEALAGALRGERLRLLGGERSTWIGWREEHPETAVALDPGTRGVLGNRGISALLKAFTSRFTTPGLHPKDYRIPLRKEVVGLSLDGAERAYPLGLLSRLGRVEDTVGQRRVELRYDVTLDRATARDLGNGAPLPLWRGWWYAWSEFHPDTSVYR